MRIDHGGTDITMSQQFLHRSNVSPSLQQMRGKRMAQYMDANVLLNARLVASRPARQSSGAGRQLAFSAAGAILKYRRFGQRRRRPAPHLVRYAHFQPEGDKAMSEKTLYERLGGYDAISAVTNDLMPRLKADSQLARFWQHRGEDGVKRETQLLIDFLCSSAGGPLYYTGRDMKTLHKGMRISESDWSAFLGHLNATLDAFQVPQAERDEVVAFIQSTKPDIAEA